MHSWSLCATGATRIEFDKKKRQMVLENYGSEPVRLNEVGMTTEQ